MLENRIIKIDVNFMKNNVADFIRILADIPGEYWVESNFLEYHPGKWEYSIAFLTSKEMIGYIIASVKHDLEAVHIHKFMIDQKYRSQGKGTILFNNFLDIVQNSTIKYVTLKVDKSNLRAIEFYKRLDFWLSGEDGKYYLMKRVI